MLFVGSSLTGYDIEATDGVIGTVSDLLFDDHAWKSRWLVVDTGHWLPGRKVLVPPSAIGFPDHERKRLPVALTKERIKDGPDIAMDAPVSRRMETRLNGYYGWDPLWGGGLLSGGAMASPLTFPADIDAAAMAPADDDAGDPNLRSVAAVTGYRIHAEDGDLGHIDNFVLDDATWGVRYLIIDVGSWWVGKRVLLSPHAVTDISWSRAEVTVNVTRDRIRTSPPWHPLETIEHAYEEGLHSHYGWPSRG